MKEAGLTVGGFYKHFDSRDAVVIEALGSAFGSWKRRIDAAASGGTPLSYESLIDDYLNEAHRDNPGTGCAFGALAAKTFAGAGAMEETIPKALLLLGTGLLDG